MKDFERREMILMRLYDLRETGEQYLTENNPPLVSELSLNDTPRICADLHELGHVEARSLHRNSSTRSGNMILVL